MSAAVTHSCSALQALDGPELWRTCDFELGEFSPDQSLLFAAATPGGDMSPDRELAVLEASNGATRLRLRLPADPYAYIGQRVWEDDDTLLAVVYSAGQWSVIRVDLDGSVEYAVPPVTGQNLVPQFELSRGGQDITR